MGGYVDVISKQNKEDFYTAVSSEKGVRVRPT